MKAFAFAAGLLLPAISASADTASRISEPLSEALTNCWNAVDTNSPAHLSGYGMAFEETKKPLPDIINLVWLGHVKTNIGDIEVRATVRDGILFECLLLTFPEPAGSDLVEYHEAEDTLIDWYGRRLSSEGHFDTLPDDRFMGLVRCERGKNTIASFAATIGVPAIEALKPDSKLPIPGGLRFVVHLTSPLDYSVCAERA